MDASLDMKTRNKLATCCLAICLMLSQTGLSDAADHIKPIFNGSFQSGEADKEAGPFKCPQIVGPMLDMSGMFAFYKPDKTQSVIDKEKMQAYVKKTWPAIQVKKSLAESLSAAFESPANAVAARACIVKQVDVWARSDAMLNGLEKNDPLGQRQAVLTIIWTGITFANALQATDQVSRLPPEQRLRFRTWFASLSKEIELNFAIKPREKKDEWLNANANQRFWAGAAVGLMAVDTGDQEAFKWAMDILKGSLDDIDKDGAMPSEMWRGARAMHYQNFALQAVSILVALADANDMRLDADQDKTLARAARFALNTYLHPENLEKATGIRQERDPGLMSWAGPLALHFRASDDKLAGELAQAFAAIGSNNLVDCQATCNPYYNRLLRTHQKQ